MRLLVDEDLPRSLARRSLSAAFDALDVRDIDLRGRSDSEIAARARDEGRVPAAQGDEQGDLG
jgi:predicted nuclease of predicted toxin-antitoxin system